MNKTYLYIFIILCALGIAGVFAFRGYKSETNETTHFAMDSIAAIAENWDVATFEGRADPGLIKAINGASGQGVEELFAEYHTLGKLKKPASCEVMNSATMAKGASDYDAVTYHCKVEFDSGPATIMITVSKKTDQTLWKIYYLKIQPESPAESVD